MDHQLAKILVAARFAAGCRLTRNEAKPHRQIASVRESLGLADRRDQRRRPSSSVWPTPSASDFIENAIIQSASTCPASGLFPGSHKTLGIQRLGKEALAAIVDPGHHRWLTGGRNGKPAGDVTMSRHQLCSSSPAQREPYSTIEPVCCH
jgi:hypothetical protein